MSSGQQTTQPAATFFLTQFLQFTRIEPDAAAFFAGISQYALDFVFLQCTIAARAAHRRGPCRFRLCRYFHFRAQLLNRFLVFAMKVFLFKSSSAIVKRVRHLFSSMINLVTQTVSLRRHQHLDQLQTNTLSYTKVSNSPARIASTMP